MIRLTATLTMLALIASASTAAQTIVVTRGGSRTVRPGPATNPAQADAAAAQPSQPVSQPQASGRPSGPVQQRIAPGLATLTDDVLFGDVWRRPELSPRDRSLVTISALIATGKPAQLAGHLGRALDNGVQASEASGLLAHLAIYCGWPSAVSALEVYDQVYTARNVDTAALRAVDPRLPAPAPEAGRARAVNDELAAVAPKFVQLTNDVVFDNLWTVRSHAAGSEPGHHRRTCRGG
jgi:4-carboxymuconolactone decarboxylase